MDALTVAPCSRKAAQHAVLSWHYSHAMPAGKLLTYGAWEDGRFIGAVLYGRGASPYLGRAYDLKAQELCELVRVALREHDAPVTQIVAASLSALRRANPGLRLVVSFADPVQGHHGGIYQAGNWVYTGTSTSTTELLIKGRWMHIRSVGAIYGTTRVEKIRRTIDPNVRERTAPPKHRYLMPLDRGMRRQVERLRKPYPRAVGAAGRS